MFVKRGESNETGDGAFGTRLRRLREAAGLTQEELASMAGMSAKAISSLGRGARKRPYQHTVHSLADALDLSEEERASLLGPRRFLLGLRLRLGVLARPIPSSRRILSSWGSPSTSS